METSAQLNKRIRKMTKIKDKIYIREVRVAISRCIVRENFSSQVILELRCG